MYVTKKQIDTERWNSLKALKIIRKYAYITVLNNIVS